MRHSRLITIGILLFILGVVLDFCLIQYSIFIVLTGNIFTIIGCLIFLKTKNNRLRVFSALTPGLPTAGFIKGISFSWEKISIVWTTCVIGAMILVHVGGLFKTSDAYKTAKKSIINDPKILNEIGEVRHFRYMVSGNITSNGYSNMNIGVIGEKGRTYINAVVYGQDGEYYTKNLEFKE